MLITVRAQGLAVLACAAACLTGCSGDKESAQKLLVDIEEVQAAAAPEAGKYVPEELNQVRDRLADLNSAFEKKDYSLVVERAPEVLSAAQVLATDAAARKDELLKGLNDDWTNLAELLPNDVIAVQAKLDQLAKKSKKTGADFDSAKAAFGDANLLWSKAQAAFAAGNLDEAVSTAKRVKSEVEAAAASLKMELPPAAVPTNT
jgi:hypothetical protein